MFGCRRRDDAVDGERVVGGVVVRIRLQMVLSESLQHRGMRQQGSQGLRVSQLLGVQLLLVTVLLLLSVVQGQHLRTAVVGMLHPVLVLLQETLLTLEVIVVGAQVPVVLQAR